MIVQIRQLWAKQKGAFSPFLFGMLAGISLFSGAVRVNAELELKRIHDQQAKRQQEETHSLRRAVENALLSETSATFGNIDANRLKALTSYGTGQTRGGQDIAVGSITRNSAIKSQRMIVSASDDALVRSEISNLATDGDNAAAAASDLNKRTDVTSVDTTTIRLRQLEVSNINMRVQSDLIYDYWSRHGALPTVGQYNTEIAAVSNLKDFWGNDFTYNLAATNYAILTYTTPWGQIVPLAIDVRSTGSTIFLSSQTYNGDLGGLSGANTKCQTLANAAGRSGSWVALLSTNYSNASTSILPTYPVRDTNAATISVSSIWSGTLSAAVTRDENGNVLSSTLSAWTGSSSSGALQSENTCGSWGSNASSDTGRTGDASATTANWLSNASTACNNLQRLYCISN